MTEYLDKYPWLLPLVVAAPLITMTWRYLLFGWNYLSSQVIRTAEFEGMLATAVMCYFWENTNRTLPMHPRKFNSWYMYVRPKKKYHVVPFEMLTGTGSLFFFGWVPVWVTQNANDDKKDDSDGSDTHLQVKIRYFRFAMKVETLLKLSCSFFNEIDDEENAALDRQRERDRFQVRRKVGSRGSSQGNIDAAQGVPTSSDSRQPDKQHMRRRRPMGYNWDELGEEMLIEGESPFDFLAYLPEIMTEVKRIGQWLKHQDWYEKRRVPWRLGMKLVGPPGSGKSSLCRSIGEEYNLPVYLFDIASMTNQDFISAWDSSVMRSPCMVVLEDVDAVFDGRRNKTNEDSMTQGLTFDCLLNCISGVGKNDGMLLVITTNNEHMLDSALTRSGRIDIELTLDGMTEECRRKVADVVLDGVDADVVDSVIAAGKEDQPADFHNRCIRAAEKWVWNHEIAASVEAFDFSPEASLRRFQGTECVTGETSKV